VLTTDVGFTTPFQEATENASKPLPVSVNVTGEMPARTRDGATDVRVGN
jgi:hypothetical protein